MYDTLITEQRMLFVITLHWLKSGNYCLQLNVSFAFLFNTKRHSLQSKNSAQVWCVLYFDVYSILLLAAINKIVQA